MRKIQVVKAQEVQIKPFAIEDFCQAKQLESFESNTIKKNLIKFAQELDLIHQKEEADFAKNFLLSIPNKENKREQ